MKVMSLALLNDDIVGLVCGDFTDVNDGASIVTRAMGFDDMKNYLAFLPGYSDRDLEKSIAVYGGLICSVKYNRVTVYFKDCINFLYSDEYPPNAMLFLVPAREDMEAFIEGLEADRQRIYL